jgi:predicted CopG family antitoxin
MSKQVIVSDEVYQKLKSLKVGESDSFNKVISRLLVEDARLNEIKVMA